MTRSFVALVLLFGITGCSNQPAKQDTPNTPYERLKAKGVTVGYGASLEGKAGYTVILRSAAPADVWDDVVQLRGINQLSIDDTDLSAEVLGRIGQLKGADRLYITIDGRGRGPTTGWEHLHKLEAPGEVWFHLFRMPIPPSAVEGVVQIPNLTELSLADCSLSDDAVGPLTSAKKLTLLNLAENDQLTDAGIGKLTAMTNLTRLELNFTQLTDDGLMELAALKQLEHLEVSYTRVTPAGVERFRKANPMCNVVR